MTRFVPFARADISQAEVDAVTAVLRSGWLTTGPEVQAFEHEFARAVGARFAVALNSCTAALHLGLEALGVRRGDEVIVPTITFTATAEVVEYLGGRTRFVDVEPGDLNVSPARVRALILSEYLPRGGAWYHRDSGARLRAMVPVHFGGQPCDMDGFLALAQEFRIGVLDDAAHAFPAALEERRIGSLGCPTAFSFYATKSITTGEGGMLTSDDPDLVSRVRLMGLHGISRDAWRRYTAEGSWYYEVIEAGFKYNLTDIAAALGRVQLQRATEMAARRSAIAARYASALGSLDALALPCSRAGTQHAWHLYPIRLHLARLTIDRAEFIAELKRLQVGTSVHFIPLHRQPFYRDRYGYTAEQFPVAETEYPRLISLPIFSAMTDEEVERVIMAVRTIHDRAAY